MNLRRYRAPARMGFAVLAAIVLPFGPASPTSAQAPEKVTIVALSADSTSEAWVAYDRGTFKQAGLDVTVSLMSSGAAIAAAVASDAANFGGANLASLATAYSKGIPFALVAPGGTTTGQAPTIGLVVAKSSPIVSAHDLNGKTVAVDSLKSLATTGTSAWVDKNGGDSRTLKFIELPFPQMDAALAQGRVDAAFIPEPILSNALAADGRLLAAPLDAISSPLLLGAWFTTAAYSKAHPDVIRKFAAVMAETAKWINEHPADSAAILQRYTKIPFSDKAHRLLQGGHLDAPSLQPLVDAAARYGVIDKTFPAVQMVAPELPASAR